MPTRIYANGNKTTAVSNMTTDLAAYLSNNSNGELVVDVQGVANYLRTQFDSISTQSEFVSPATAATSAAAAKAVNIANIVNALEGALGVGAWSSRSDWPTGADVLSGAELVSAVKDLMAECKTLSDQITAYYDLTNRAVEDILTAKFYELGLDAVVPPGVVRQIETRSVVYTYVTDRDEESAPSPPSELAELDQNDTAEYTATAPPSGRHVNRIRWYRSRSASQTASFDFVAEVAVGTLAYTDEKKAEELQEPCPTLTWDEPPADLAGLVEGPNGGMAGFIEGSNTVCFAENFVGYAWPEEYRKTTAWPVVGIGRFDQTYVVLTRGKPYYMTGPDSASIASQMVDSDQACVSRRSIVSGYGGVKYASPDGICIANASGVRLLTEQHFDRDAWQALSPGSIFAAEVEGLYVFHYDNGTTSGCYAIDLDTGKLVTIDATGSAFYRDLVSDRLYLAQGTAIKAMFASATKRTGSWKTKLAVLPRPANMGWLQADSDFESALTVRIYRDGELTDTKVLASRAPVRISSGRALEYEVEVEGAVRGTSVTIASTAEELRSV
jgi:hypothetical protein